jgi:uncharacterized protein YggE
MSRLGLAVLLTATLGSSACASMGSPDGMPRRPSTVTVSGVGTVMMSAAVPVAPGEQEIQASVTVTFTLEP